MMTAKRVSYRQRLSTLLVLILGRREERAFEKGEVLLEAGCIVSEFGTRRRRSYDVQDIVVGELLRAAHEFPGKGKVAGTSNVRLFT